MTSNQPPMVHSLWETMAHTPCHRDFWWLGHVTRTELCPTQTTVISARRPHHAPPEDKRSGNRNAVITTMLETFQSSLHYLPLNLCSSWENEPVLPSPLQKTVLAAKEQSACSYLLTWKVQNWQWLTSCQAYKWLSNTLQLRKKKLPRKSTCFCFSSVFAKQCMY